MYGQRGISKQEAVNKAIQKVGHDTEFETLYYWSKFFYGSPIAVSTVQQYRSAYRTKNGLTQKQKEKLGLMTKRDAVYGSIA